jgi:hypothetical protein
MSRRGLLLPANGSVEVIEVVRSESTMPMVAMSCSVMASEISEVFAADLSTSGSTAMLSTDPAVSDGGHPVHTISPAIVAASVPAATRNRGPSVLRDVPGRIVRTSAWGSFSDSRKPASRSPTLWKRRVGSLSSARSTVRMKDSGTSGRRSRSGWRWRLACACASCSIDFATTGNLPVTR